MRRPEPTHQDSLWFHGGNLHQSRHYSQFLSLQLKARMEGLDTPVYGMGPVHHLGQGLMVHVGFRLLLQSGLTENEPA
jgi:hypothetical protein